MDLVRHFCVIGIVALVGPFCDETRQGTQFLISTHGLNIFVQNLIGRWLLRRIGNNFDQIWVFRWDTVLVREAGDDARSFGAATGGRRGLGVWAFPVHNTAAASSPEFLGADAWRL